MKTYLSKTQFREKFTSGLKQVDWTGKNVLVLIPDRSRTAPVGLFFRQICEALYEKTQTLDFMIALGTHKPLNEEEIEKLLEVSAADRQQRYPDLQVFNHEWDKPENLISVGSISAGTVQDISRGLLEEEIEVTINKKVYDYDTILICGPVFPHEVVGFSGGSKYLFPGISGPEMINMTHWLGALITCYEIIGTQDTPVRRLIEMAAAMLPVDIVTCAFVNDTGGVYDLFVSRDHSAWEQAAQLAARTHVNYVENPYERVIAKIPNMYDELWTGAKGMYKLEPIVADGGELIIYAPHLQEISHTHGELICKIGYHVRDYLLENWETFGEYPKSVLAHSTHLKGIGVMENGVEKARIRVTLATGLDEKTCRELNLGYADPQSVNIGENKPGTLVVDHAGEKLFRLKSRGK